MRGCSSIHHVITTAATTDTTIAPIHHQRIRYSAAGNDRAKNRPKSDQDADRDPAARERARASSADR